MVPTNEDKFVASCPRALDVTAYRLEAADVVAYIAEATADEVVSVFLDGRPVLMAFELDESEHARRVVGSLGPVRSRGLLHALWALPEGLSWPASGISQLDADTLRHEGAGHVMVTQQSIHRVYRPAGRVSAIGIKTQRLANAVERVSEFPPIFRRYAVGTKAATTDVAALEMAQAVGVGSAVAHSNGLRVLAAAEPPKAGVPSIYRWWLAEVAYHALVRRMPTEQAAS